MMLHSHARLASHTPGSEAVQPISLTFDVDPLPSVPLPAVPLPAVPLPVVLLPVAPQLLGLARHVFRLQLLFYPASAQYPFEHLFAVSTPNNNIQRWTKRTRLTP